MRILFLNWRDIKNPLAGGAEVVTHQYVKALKERGDEVHFVSAEFPGCKKEEVIDGIITHRGGSKFSVPIFARKFYKENGPFDVVIDECNTNQFFSSLYVPRKERIFYINQLTRQIWFYQMSFPLNLAGYLLEPIFLLMQSRSNTITISKSTKDHLVDFGFSSDNIGIVTMGIDSKPDEELIPVNQKDKNQLIYVGRLVKYKRVHDIIIATAALSKKNPSIKLDVVGDGDQKYKDYLQKLVQKLGISDKVKFHGHIPKEKRNQLMRKAWVIVVASILEGWGLIVTEANAVGTPACVYNVGGLRDSVKHNKTGLVTKENTPEELAENIQKLLGNTEGYTKLREQAWQYSKTLTFDRMKKEFVYLVDKYANK